MKLQFLGATETVTGSKFLLYNASAKFMIDCGLFQGFKELRLRNWAPLPVPVVDINSVVITHAHIDHSGYFPVFVKQGFRGRAYASAPTVELCKILLPDSGFLQEEDAVFATKKGFSKHAPALPLYTYSDAVASLKYLAPIPNGKPFDLGHGIKVKLIPAGHILGARFVHVTSTIPSNRTILFAGDIGRYDDIISKAPSTVKEIDYLVMESTYGDKMHPEEDVFSRLEKIINKTVERGGKVLIPAFAVGRTQEIIYIIKKLQAKKRIPSDIPVYLNTPMGIDATQIYRKYADEENFFKHGIDEDSFQLPNLHLVHTQEESKSLNLLAGPAIILSASGMMTGGRILHHLKAYGPDAKSTLVLVGFQAAGTRGRNILDGTRSIKIHGQPIALNCDVEFIDSISAHGDYEDIMQWLSLFNRPPKTTFLVHGEEKATAALAERVREKFHWNVVVPKYLDEVELK
ncbi:MAG: MBL fold metallo-hydrolase [Deltaproteobacteria bacterium]|nr:MBL fold metallo-hydrolase [Deltaproteobacteria bacterium]